MPAMSRNFEPLPIPDADAYAVTEEELEPLLSMTSLVGAPWLQAEAAASLCKMASEGNPVLWCDRVFKSIAGLLDATSTDVAHPTACCVSHLAQQPGAMPCFASDCLWAKLVAKASASQTHPQVAGKLAQALSAALRQHAATIMVQDVPTLLLWALDLALGLRQDLNPDVVRHFEQARLLIERHAH